MRKDHIASHLLAYATEQVFPAAKLVGGGANPLSFYYHFIFDFEFNEECLRLIEEKLRAFLASPVDMKLMEMIPSNAAELLKHHRREIRGQVVSEAQGGLVNILKIDGFYDYIGGISSTRVPFKSSKVIGFERVGHWMGQDVIRIIGVGGEDQSTLKQKVKALKEAQKLRHEVVGEKLKLFRMEDEGVYWHAGGEQVRQLLISEWREQVKALGVEMISTPGLRPLAQRFEDYQAIEIKKYRLSELNQVKRDERSGEGLFRGGITSGDCIRLMGNKKGIEGDLEKGLELIHHFWKLGGLTKGGAVKVDFDTLLNHEGEVELRGADLFGRSQKISSLQLQRVGKEFYQLDVRVIWDLNAFIGMMLEKNRGALPFFFQPLQVEVATLSKNLLEAKEAFKKEVEGRGFRIRECEQAFKSKGEMIGYAKRSKAGYFIGIVGEEEGLVSKQGDKNFESAHLKDLADILKRE